MKTLIIDHDLHAANRLEKMMEIYDSNIEVLDKIDSVRDAVRWFNHNTSPDLIFMDVQLSDGLCFDIFNEANVHVPVIFTVPHGLNAEPAFKKNRLSYLLKPFSYEDFEAGLNQYVELKKQQEKSVSSDLLQHDEANSPVFKSRFVVRIGEHLHTIRTEDIGCFVSKEKMTWLYRNDGKRFILDYTMEQLEQVLNPQLFFRINRKCLVHIDSILDIKVYMNSRLKISIDRLEGTEDMVVSREKVQDFKGWLDR